MHIFDVLEAWMYSISVIVDTSAIAAKIERSPSDRPDSSWNLNLRYGDYEADLLVWESGAAELIVGNVGGQVRQVHFPDIRTRGDLAKLLSMLADFIATSRVR